MQRPHVTRQRVSRPRTAETDSREKKLFVQKQPVLYDSQSKLGVQPGQATEKKRPITSIMKKLWRWAYLSTPFVAACSTITNDDRVTTASISMATIGGMTAALAAVMGAIVGVQKLVNYVKKKTNPPLPGDNTQK